MRLKRLLFLLPVVMGLIFLVALLLAQPVFHQKPNDLIYHMGADAKKLNPILSADTTSSTVTGLVFNGLVKYDQDLHLVGDLAKSWDIRQESNFFLKANSGLTARQAVRLLDRKLSSKVRDEFKIRSISALAPDRVGMKFDSGGIAYHKALLKIIATGKIDPVKLIRLTLDTKAKYPDKSPCDATETAKRLKTAFADVPGLPERVLAYSIERSDELVIHVRGSEVEALKVIQDTLPADAGKIREVQTRLIQDEPLLTFYLRKGVKFHDGTEFTSKDVRYLYDTVMDENVLTVRRSDFELIKDVRTPDAYTVVVRYKKPYASAVSNWGYGIMPAHLYSKEEDFNESDLNRAPVGTGPFKFVEWKTDRHIRLEAFQGYFEGKPQLDGITFRILPEAALAQMAFLSKTIDIYGPDPSEQNRLKATPGVVIFRRPINVYSYIGWNMENDLFKDIRIRKALTLATNRDDIVKHVYWGVGRVSNGMFPQHLWFSNPDVKPLPFDIEESKRLLAEAGWRDTDGDGYLDRNGERFAFKLIYNSNNPQRKSIATIAQQQFKNLGIKVEIASYEWSAFLDRINKRNFEACVLGWSLGMDADPYQPWHSSQREKGFNFVGYVNTKVDRLIELARTELVQERRKVHLFKIHKLVHDDQPYTFLVVSEGITAMYDGAFRIRRRDPKTGKVIDEPIKMTKAGILYYLKDWYRVETRTEQKD